MSWGVKIWWKYGSDLQLLRVDSELDMYIANSNEGTKMPEERHKPCLWTMKVGRRESLILTWGGKEGNGEKPGDHLSKSWNYKLEYNKKLGVRQDFLMEYHKQGDGKWWGE